MENWDLTYICTVIGNLSGIPIRLFENEKMLFRHTIVDLPEDPFSLYRKDIFSTPSDLGYYITPSFHYYGFVRNGRYTIVLGPTRQTPENERDLKELAFQLDISKDNVSDFIKAMKGIVMMPLESILQILCVINYVLNQDKKSLKDISIFDKQQEIFKNQFEASRIDKTFYSSTEIQKQQDLHNTLALEQSLMNIVQKGNLAALNEWISKAPAIRGGILAVNQLRQLKNTFIVTATLTSRAAIRGGMDSEDALSLSDAYIQQCELLFSMTDITNLQYRMVLDFTERVEQIRFGKNPSPLIIDIINYIHHHLSESITTQEIAKSLYISRSRLSTKFKKETGINLSDFILQEKIEEAKRLLRYSDKSLATISSYLGFSSQSHFSKVFKTYALLTPKEYRFRHHH